jgi:hypothetical protein
MKTVKEIADALNKMESYFVEHDGCNEDTRIHLNQDNWKIDVHAPTMGKKEYTRMEKLLDKECITKDEYEVYAWNDVSGWKYWNKEGKEQGVHGMNYIMITANITDVENVDLSELKRDMEEMWQTFQGFNNFEEISDKYWFD